MIQFTRALLRLKPSYYALHRTAPFLIFLAVPVDSTRFFSYHFLSYSYFYWLAIACLSLPESDDRFNKRLEEFHKVGDWLPSNNL
jgi:hypothetical protein